jgi:hypothetical protein
MRPSIMSDGAMMSAPGRRLVERLADQHLDRGVVQHIAGRIDQAVLPVAGIGIERNIGEHAHIAAPHRGSRGSRGTSGYRD